ncbi:MAG TPA: SIS domain-containing protein [Candidatus Nanopelagicales bacterium]
MPRYADDRLLDDPAALAQADPGDLLRATADAGAQVRRALAAATPELLRAVAADGRPRSVVVVGLGTAGVVGDALAAVCGTGCPVPVSTLRGRTLPGWVGPLDLVVAVSLSGRTGETLAVSAEAAKRGCRLYVVTSSGSPLEAVALAATGGAVVNVDPRGVVSRAALWLMLAPVLLAADALGLADVSRSELDRVADLLDERAVENGPAAPLADNAAKLLGATLSGSAPVVWGSGVMGAVASYRLAAQLAQNAKLTVSHGVLPEVVHAQAAALDGATPDDGDIFRDPFEDGAAPARTRLVLVRDAVEHPQDATSADLLRAAAERRDVPVDVVRSVEGHPVARLASLLGVLDWASVYAAVAVGVDPSSRAGDLAELVDAERS